MFCTSGTVWHCVLCVRAASEQFQGKWLWGRGIQQVLVNSGEFCRCGRFKAMRAWGTACTAPQSVVACVWCCVVVFPTLYMGFLAVPGQRPDLAQIVRKRPEKLKYFKFSRCSSSWGGGGGGGDGSPAAGAGREMGQALVILAGRACQTAVQGEIKQCSVRLALFGSVFCACGLLLSNSKDSGCGVAGSNRFSSILRKPAVVGV